MKKTLFLLLFVAGGFSLFGQNTVLENPETELLKAYTQPELNTLKKEQPENYQALIFGLKNAMSVEKVNFGTKEVSLSTIDVDIDNLPTFASLGIKIKNENQYFLIANSDKVLLVKSFYLLKNKF